MKFNTQSVVPRSISLFNSSQHTWLKEISDAPKELFVEGVGEVLSASCFSIVGTRNPTHYGIRAALYFSKKLASLGFTIVSGLARGIDSYAHRGALLAGGKTAAILGHGLGRIYPAQHYNLAREILNYGGCLVSEYGWYEPPLKHHFPERNRIISGLSCGTLIIEAAEKSGSLITARLALEQNREVFVVPSRFDESSFRGSHLLLQEGAKLVLTVEDILGELGFEIPQNINSMEEDFRWSNLKSAFDSHQGMLTLSILSSYPSSYREILRQQLYLALSEKKVIETSPQLFFWVD